MKIIALLTGRSNNTLPDKNILDILGYPVLYYPAHAATKTKIIDAFYCSSDNEKILAAAKNEGYTEIKRPPELSQPNSQHIDAIIHALNEINRRESLPDILVVLLANNITVKSSWTEQCLNIMLDDMTISAVVPIYKDNDHHPLRAKIIDSQNRLQMYEKVVDKKISTNRQDLPECYFLAHNFWILNVKLMLKNEYRGQPPWTFMGNNIAYFKVSQSIDIHNSTDLLLATDWIKHNYID